MSTEPLDAERIFVRRQSTHNTAAWCLVAGLAGIGFAVSRLAEGEVESRDLADSPTVMIVLSAVLMAMCVVFLAAAVMQWSGWDIDLDSKTGKISIKRFGAGQ